MAIATPSEATVYDPFQYPVFLDRWVATRKGFSRLRVERVVCPDGAVLYYAPCRPSFLYPEPLCYAARDVFDSEEEARERYEELCGLRPRGRTPSGRK